MAGGKKSAQGPKASEKQPIKRGKSQGDDSDKKKKKVKPNEEDDGEIAEVERILGKKIKKGEVQYLIKWKDTADGEGDWMPAAKLDSIKELIEEFEKNQKMRDESEKSEHSKKKTPKKKEEGAGGKKSKNAKKKGDMDVEDASASKKDPEEEMKEAEAKLAKDNDSERDIIASLVKEGKITTSHGHYIYGDTADKIFFERVDKKVNGDRNFVFIVTWNKRADGSLPKETEFSSNELTNYDPNTLIRYYESKLFVKSPNAQQEIVQRKVDKIKQAEKASTTNIFKEAGTTTPKIVVTKAK